LRKGRKEWTGELPKIGYNGAKLQDSPTFAFLQYALEGMYVSVKYFAHGIVTLAVR